jgi:hypothetical protein
MIRLNTLNNKKYDNEYLFLDPTRYGIDDLVDIIVQPEGFTSRSNIRVLEAIDHALNELHHRGITKLSRLLEVNLNYPIDEIQERIAQSIKGRIELREPEPEQRFIHDEETGEEFCYDEESGKFKKVN